MPRMYRRWQRRLPIGSAYTINGQKRWITNGGIATGADGHGLAHGAGLERDEDHGVPGDARHAGFEVLEKRMEKCGVRGSATARLAFNKWLCRRRISGATRQGAGASP